MASIVFNVFGAKSVARQAIKVDPIEHHYEEKGDPEYIKYSCPICDEVEKEYSKKCPDKDKKFQGHSLVKGIPTCPCCGININWSKEKFDKIKLQGTSKDK